jgi:hypothetical protein
MPKHLDTYLTTQCFNPCPSSQKKLKGKFCLTYVKSTSIFLHQKIRGTLSSVEHLILLIPAHSWNFLDESPAKCT